MKVGLDLGTPYIKEVEWVGQLPNVGDLIVLDSLDKEKDLNFVVKRLAHRVRFSENKAEVTVIDIECERAKD